MDEYAKRFTALLKEAGIKNKDIVLALGVSNAAVCSWKTGKSKSKEIVGLARMIGVEAALLDSYLHKGKPSLEALLAQNKSFDVDDKNESIRVLVTRKNNLLRVLKANFKTKRDLGKALSKSPSHVGSWFSKKGIGGNSAREIEKKLEFEPYFLDRDNSRLDDKFFKVNQTTFKRDQLDYRVADLAAFTGCDKGLLGQYLRLGDITLGEIFYSSISLKKSLDTESALDSRLSNSAIGKKDVSNEEMLLIKLYRNLDEEQRKSFLLSL